MKFLPLCTLNIGPPRVSIRQRQVFGRLGKKKGSQYPRESLVIHPTLTKCMGNTYVHTYRKRVLLVSEFRDLGKGELFGFILITFGPPINSTMHKAIKTFNRWRVCEDLVVT